MNFNKSKYGNPHTILVKLRISESTVEMFKKLGVREAEPTDDAKETKKWIQEKESNRLGKVATRTDKVTGQVRVDTGNQILKGDEANTNLCCVMSTLMDDHGYLIKDTVISKKQNLHGSKFAYNLVVSFTTNEEDDVVLKNHDEFFDTKVGVAIYEIAARIYKSVHIWENSNGVCTVNCTGAAQNNDVNGLFLDVRKNKESQIEFFINNHNK